MYFADALLMGGVDDPYCVVHLRARPPAGCLRHMGEQVGKQPPGPLGIGIGQRRAGGQLGADMIEPAPVAAHRRLDLAQADRAGQLTK